MDCDTVKIDPGLGTGEGLSNRQQSVYLECFLQLCKNMCNILVYKTLWIVQHIE